MRTGRGTPGSTLLQGPRDHQEPPLENRTREGSNEIAMGNAWMPRTLPPVCLSAVLLALAGCGDEPQEGGFASASGTGGATDASASTTASSGGATTAGATSVGSVSASGGGTTNGGSGSAGSATGNASASTSGGGGATATTTGGGATTTASTGGSTGGVVCTKVDVVFAVDNSGSMQQEIAAMQGPVFDALPDQLLMVGNGIDEFHLGVINGCPKPGFLHDTGKGGACNFSTGTNWMSSDSPNLDAEYACVMDLSNSGYMGIPHQCQDSGALKDDDEQPAQAASAAISPPAVDNENAGFLQDDAILFVVAMTDEDEELIDDVGDPITPQDIVDRFVAAKGTIDNVVFLGIGGDSNCNGPYGSAKNAQNLKAVTQIFIDADRGLFWDLCQGNLEQAFAEAIQLVDQACEEIIPQ